MAGIKKGKLSVKQKEANKKKTREQSNRKYKAQVYEHVKDEQQKADYQRYLEVMTHALQDTPEDTSHLSTYLQTILNIFKRMKGDDFPPQEAIPFLLESDFLNTVITLMTNYGHRDQDILTETMRGLNFIYSAGLHFLEGSSTYYENSNFSCYTEDTLTKVLVFLSELAPIAINMKNNKSIAIIITYIITSIATAQSRRYTNCVFITQNSYLTFCYVFIYKASNFRYLFSTRITSN
jgi:hypothetical protein